MFDVPRLDAAPRTASVVTTDSSISCRWPHIAALSVDACLAAHSGWEDRWTKPRHKREGTWRFLQSRQPPPARGQRRSTCHSSARRVIWLSQLRRPGAPLEHRPEGHPRDGVRTKPGNGLTVGLLTRRLGLEGQHGRSLPSMTHRGTRFGTLHRPLPPATVRNHSVGLLLFVTNK